MSTLDERIQRIEDDTAIRELVARFADISTRGDLEAFPELWISPTNSKPGWTLSKPFSISATGIDEIMDMARKPARSHVTSSSS